MARTALKNWLSDPQVNRRKSKDAFGREFLAETGFAIAALEGDTFLFEDVEAVLQETAKELGIEPPSSAQIRKDLQRIRDVFGAVERLPKLKGEQLRRETKKTSAFWSLLSEFALSVRSGRFEERPTS